MCTRRWFLFLQRLYLAIRLNRLGLWSHSSLSQVVFDLYWFSLTLLLLLVKWILGPKLVHKIVQNQSIFSYFVYVLCHFMKCCFWFLRFESIKLVLWFSNFTTVCIFVINHKDAIVYFGWILATSVYERRINLLD